MEGCPTRVGLPSYPPRIASAGSPPPYWVTRPIKHGVCRGAKPLCRESEGVPQKLFSYSSPFLARKGARGMVAKGDSPWAPLIQGPDADPCPSILHLEAHNIN